MKFAGYYESSIFSILIVTLVTVSLVSSGYYSYGIPNILYKYRSFESILYIVLYKILAFNCNIGACSDSRHSM